MNIQPEKIISTLKGVPTKEELTDMLTEQVLDITFDKLNGDERTMKCTLVPAFLPKATKEDTLSQTKVRNLEDRIVVVWMVEGDHRGWRSMRYDRIKKVEIDDSWGDGLE